jgi:predicted transcriptional regulator
MPVTLDEIDRFVRFAKEAARRENLANSLEECLRLWREQQEIEETVAAVRRGEEDIAAGRCSTLEEADAWVRSKAGSHRVANEI